MSQWKAIPGVNWEYKIVSHSDIRFAEIGSVAEIVLHRTEVDALTKFFADYAAGKLPEQKSKVRTQ